MAQVKVQAKQMGYYNHKRQREGSVFFMDEKEIKYEKGQVVSPKWVDVLSGKKAEKAPKSVDPATVIEDEEVI